MGISTPGIVRTNLVRNLLDFSIPSDSFSAWQSVFTPAQNFDGFWIMGSPLYWETFINVGLGSTPTPIAENIPLSEFYNGIYIPLPLIQGVPVSLQAGFYGGSQTTDISLTAFYQTPPKYKKSFLGVQSVGQSVSSGFFVPAAANTVELVGGPLTIGSIFQQFECQWNGPGYFTAELYYGPSSSSLTPIVTLDLGGGANNANGALFEISSYVPAGNNIYVNSGSTGLNLACMFYY